MLSEDGADLLVVFSHPNHELAVYGLLQRLKPNVMYLTDGGGQDRVEQTVRGLTEIGLLDRATFLDHSEQSFYNALLDRDVGFFRGICRQIGEGYERMGCRRVLCDAVEFYNPVHDLPLPLVQSAFRQQGTKVYEVPLIHQKTLGMESFGVQRFPPSRRSKQLEFCLTTEECVSKARARDEIYTILNRQLGDTLRDLTPEHLGLEVLALAEEPVGQPGGDRVLRYEHRAQRLLRSGDIERGITYRHHYLPVLQELAR